MDNYPSSLKSYALEFSALENWFFKVSVFV